MMGSGSVGAASAEQSKKMLQRCWGWDYKSPCIYQITIALADRRSEALGRLVIDSDGEGDPIQVEAHVELTAAGRAVEAEWRRMGEFTPAIRPLEIQVMPDHIHFILRVTERLARPLGQILAGFKTGSSKAATGKPGFWSEGFQDTILFREGQLENMFTYLRDNPRRLAVKRLYRKFFTVKRDLAVEVGLTPAQQNNSGGLALHFQAIGNEALLKSPMILQVQCSRSYLAYKRVAKPGGGLKIARDEAGRPIVERETPEFGEKLKMLLSMAEKGAVLISPCISDGEREIARRALEANAKLVTFSNKGFSPLFKPSGRAFDSASEGRLLMLAPAGWPYCPGEKKMTRFDACALNRIAQLMAGDGAAEINYHGMKPSNVDGLVAEACRADARPTGQEVAR
ncbi:MAG: hypothetical protein IKC15_01960 [Kiritimatiellae bacterium]|nr:hypothetical protein [Kiritimatiellia bacterium]